MYDFKSRGLCSLGPCFASCFKKMKNSKMKEKTQTQFEMMDNQSRYSFMLGKLVALDTEYRIQAGRIGDLKSLKAQDVLLVQIESNFNFKKRVLKWHGHRVISCKVASKILLLLSFNIINFQKLCDHYMFLIKTLYVCGWCSKMNSMSPCFTIEYWSETK